MGLQTRHTLPSLYLILAPSPVFATSQYCHQVINVVMDEHIDLDQSPFDPAPIANIYNYTFPT